MSAVEHIEAAIRKLEHLRATASPGIGDSYWVHDSDVHIDGVGNLGRESWPGVFATAELIVTLHRTIDAQLAILRAGRSSYHYFPTDIYGESAPGWAAEARALALPLADAILGGEEGS